MNENRCRKISCEIKTPAYVFSKDDFTERVKNTRKILGERIALCYSIKANPFLIDTNFDPTLLFDMFEVCSPGEASICRACKIPMEKILFTGINKESEQIEKAIETGIRIFNVESLLQLKNIDNVAGTHGITVEVLLRISADSQFGMDEDVVLGIIRDRACYQNLEIKGIHYFSGTKKKSYEVIKKELKLLEAFCERSDSEYGFIIPCVEYGPGLDADCFHDQTYGSTDISQIANDMKKLSDVTHLTIEMGRYFAYDSGYYFTRVVDCKKNGDTNYAVVDGGMHQLHYDGQFRGMKKLYMYHFPNGDRLASGVDELWTVCGSICSTEDVIVSAISMTGLKEGDVLVFLKCGAYSINEGMSTFLSRELPSVWAYSDNDGLELLRDSIETDQFNLRRGIFI